MTDTGGDYSNAEDPACVTDQRTQRGKKTEGNEHRGERTLRGKRKRRAYCIVLSSGAAHAVVGRLKGAIAPVLQAVPNVDGDGPGDGVEGHPLSLLGLLAVCGQP